MATVGTPRRPASTGGGGTRGPARPPSAPRRNGRSRRRPSRGRRVWNAIKSFFLAVTILILVALITAIATIGLQLSKAPTTIDLTFNPPGVTYIYSGDDILLAQMSQENRRVVAIEKIPKDLQNATVAFEDRRFYQHAGIDFTGIARALFRNVKSGDLKGEGASTITQQLARNMGVGGLTREKSFSRKVHELILSNQIEKSYTKQRILEMYLNEVNYGSGAYGVQAAAQTYFGRDVSKLSLAQCALLAGLPNRPNTLNPYHNPDGAKAQRNIVLDQMLEEHYITPQQCAAAKAQPVRLAYAKPPSGGTRIYHAQYFVNYVIDQLKQKYGEDLQQGNLRVYTTLNWKMQQIAEQALREGIERAGGRGPTQGALVALDPRTGQIKAMVGGLDYAKSQFNIAAQALRQPGSTFKIIDYSAAIESGIVTEDTRVFDGPVRYVSGGKPYIPKDDDGYRYRDVTLREAMAQSINVPAVKVMHELGPQTAIRYAHMMGIQPTTQLAPYLSLALGSSGVTPLEMASVYGTVADGGNHALVTAVSRLTDADGKTIEDMLPQVETHILSQSTVHQVDDMLRAVVEEGTGTPVGDVPEARGKTGTTQSHKDVWFDGYVPGELACVVWAGHPLKGQYGAEMAGNAWGATVCAPIWRNFMLQALPIFKAAQAKEAARHKTAAKPKPAPAPTPVVQTDTAPPAPDNGGDESPAEPSTRRGGARADRGDAASADPSLVTVNVDDNTGLLAPRRAPHSHRETFARGAEPTVMSPEYDRANTAADAAPPPPDDGGGPAPPDGRTTSRQDASDNGDALPAPRRRQRRSSGDGGDGGGGSGPEYVTVRVNPDDGLRATKWTPQYVERRYIKGQEPKRYTREYAPPPGEH